MILYLLKQNIMLGSFSTFSYLPPRYWIFRLFKRWWRTQDKDIYEQYSSGIRFFDIRVVYDWKNREWTFGSRLVMLKSPWKFKYLSDICDKINSDLPDCFFRIILETGSEGTRSLFIRQSQDLCKEYSNLWEVGIRFDNKSYNVVSRNKYIPGYGFSKYRSWEKPNYEYCTPGMGKKNIVKVNSELFDKIGEIKETRDNLIITGYCTDFGK